MYQINHYRIKNRTEIKKNLHIVEFNKQYYDIDKNNIHYWLSCNRRFTRNYMNDNKLLLLYYY